MQIQMTDKNNERFHLIFCGVFWDFDPMCSGVEEPLDRTRRDQEDRRQRGQVRRVEESFVIRKNLVFNQKQKLFKSFIQK